MERYRVVDDASANWYVIPADKLQEFARYEEGEHLMPEWAQALDGFPGETLTFTDPVLGA